MISRRILITVAWVALGLGATPAVAQEKTRIKFTLDWKLQSIHAPYLVALEKGYFSAENLDVTIDQGEGSAATITRIMSGAYDAGFGDLNAVIQNAATRPADAPVIVYMVYNSAPFALLTKAAGPIKTVADLAGKKLGAPANSAALKLFPLLAKKSGLDATKVEVLNMAPNLQEQLLIQGQVDATAVFTVTSYANLIGQRLDPEKDFRWITYKDAGLGLYSNGIAISQKLAREKPEAVKGLVRAINRAMRDVIADPSVGVAAVAAKEPLLNKPVETARLAYALRSVIVTKEVERIGLGDVDDARLAANIDVIAKAYELSNPPTPKAVFDRSFLPPKDDRTMKSVQ